MVSYGKKSPRRSTRRVGRKSAARPTKSNGLRVQKAVINPALRKYVNKIVKSNEETKFFTTSIAYKQSILGSGFNTTGNFGYNTGSNILPVIQQGTGQQQRIGNRISTSGYFMVRGHVLALPTAALTNPYNNVPFYVKIVVWRQKPSMTTVSNTEIMDDGLTAGGVNFDGTLDDLMVPFNKDKFLIGATRTFMLQPNASTGTYSNENISKYPVSKFFKLRVPIPKTLSYNDVSADPTNCRWYLSAGIVNCDGALAINTIARAQITSEAVFRYKDA